ncbi:lipase [Peniophora sp. CONT]|nr:lipase [Peniophora sp. CONT]
MIPILFASLLALGSGALATPVRRQSAVSASQIASYTPYAYYAAAAYCPASTFPSWSCGSQCNANSGFQVIASGGDGSDIQNWFVGYDKKLDSIIVSHEGTNTSSITSILSDGEVIRSSLDSTLFPGVPSGVSVHDGFADAQADTATAVLAAVKSGLSTYGTNTVAITGHSLGAAIALIDAVYLKPNLPSSTSIKMFGFGLPRVGNQDWANYVDSTQSVTHINNKEDPVPILPGMFLGYHHPSGEIHIQDSGEWDSCPGQDNDSDLCTTGDVPNIFDGETSDHDGPYSGVMMGHSACV